MHIVSDFRFKIDEKCQNMDYCRFDMVNWQERKKNCINRKRKWGRDWERERNTTRQPFLVALNGIYNYLARICFFSHHLCRRCLSAVIVVVVVVVYASWNSTKNGSNTIKKTMATNLFFFFFSRLLVLSIYFGCSLTHSQIHCIRAVIDGKIYMYLRKKQHTV